MKKILLLFFFSGSLDSFSQVPDTSYMRKFDPERWGIKVNPDTIRATLIVYYDSGPAILHTKHGYVVREYGEEDIYLDDKKRLIKAPLEVLTYKVKK